MNYLQPKQVYRWIQALSLDVVLGSGLLNLAIAKYYGVRLPGSVLAALMLSVWLIYTFDHLSDAKKLQQEAVIYRHRFHQRHYNLLQGVWVLALLVGLGLLLALPAVVLQWGLLAALGVALYFLCLRLYACWYKELLIAVCYTLGVFLAPLCLLQQPLNLFQLLLVPQILLLALANLVLFSYFDFEADQKDGHPSLALRLGLARSRKLIFALLFAGLAACGLLFFFAALLITREIQLLLFGMNLLLLLLLLKEDRFRQHELYRILGDGIFFFPAFLLLYAW